MLVRMSMVAALLSMMPSAVAHAGDGGGGSSGGSSSEGSSSAGSSSEDSSSSSGETSGTDTTGTEGTSTEATTTSGTTVSGGDTSSSDGGCGSCPTGDASVTFDTPQDAATIDAPFPVIVDIVPRCPCFDCTCAAEDFEYVQLFLDTVVWAGPCHASPCEWTVTVAEPDEYLLTARAHYPSGDASTSVFVRVAAVSGGSTGYEDPTLPSDDGSEPTTSGPAATTPASDDGCGCTSGRTTPAVWLVLPCCLLLVGRTRRR